MRFLASVWRICNFPVILPSIPRRSLFLTRHPGAITAPASINTTPGLLSRSSLSLRLVQRLCICSLWQPLSACFAPIYILQLHKSSSVQGQAAYPTDDRKMVRSCLFAVEGSLAGPSSRAHTVVTFDAMWRPSARKHWRLIRGSSCSAGFAAIFPRFLYQ